ncbi:hypothetical protein UW163_10315 [Ralstonia solanacearum]|nr:hypothetical protein UW163_10315 [Ralstonia solanacearum]
MLGLRFGDEEIPHQAAVPHSVSAVRAFRYAENLKTTISQVVDARRQLHHCCGRATFKRTQAMASL